MDATRHFRVIVSIASSHPLNGPASNALIQFDVKDYDTGSEAKSVTDEQMNRRAD